MTTLPWRASSWSETTPDSDAPARHRVRFTVAYHGEPFAGLARNEGVDTVAGRLEDALSLITGGPVRLIGAGRTDRGVHAIGQVISTDLPVGMSLESVSRRVNSLCAPHISVRDARVVGEDFDARRSATSRSYRYVVWNGDVPSPLLADRAWHVPYPLELAGMRAAAAAVVGEHDFTSLCRRPPELGADEPLRRRVLRAEWEGRPGGLLVFDITGAAFCHQMVRSIVGLCVDIGRGRRSASDVLEIIAARDRAASAPIAPPHGLCLMEVGYPTPVAAPAAGRSRPADARPPWGDHLPGPQAGR